MYSQGDQRIGRVLAFPCRGFAARCSHVTQETLTSENSENELKVTMDEKTLSKA